MKNLKVGERVIYYHSGRRIGTITAVDCGKHCAGPLAVEDDQKVTTYVHPQQCRRIKPPRDRIWVNFPLMNMNSQWGVSYPGVTRDNYSMNNWKEFVEVRKK